MIAPVKNFPFPLDLNPCHWGIDHEKGIEACETGPQRTPETASFKESGNRGHQHLVLLTARSPAPWGPGPSRFYHPKMRKVIVTAPGKEMDTTFVIEGPTTPPPII